MKSSTKDKIQGVAEEIEGTVKKGAGRLSGDRGLGEEGEGPIEGRGAEEGWRSKEDLQ